MSLLDKGERRISGLVGGANKTETIQNLALKQIIDRRI